MVSMMDPGSVHEGVLIRECLTTAPTRSSTTKVRTAGSRWTPTAYIPPGFSRSMVLGLPGPVPSLPASTIRFWSSRRREMLEMVCGERPTICASSTRLRPPGARRIASRMTVRLKSPIRGRFVPRRGEGVRISVTDTSKRLRPSTADLRMVRYRRPPAPQGASERAGSARAGAPGAGGDREYRVAADLAGGAQQSLQERPVVQVAVEHRPQLPVRGQHPGGGF